MNKLLFPALGVMLVLSLGLNVALARGITERDREIDRLSGAVVELKEEARLPRGQTLPPLVGEDSTGEPWHLDPSESPDPTLLYAYASTCSWCAKNLDNIRFLSEMLRSGYRVVGLSLSETPVSEREKEVEWLGFPILFEVSEETAQTYRLGGTPQTLLLSSEGAVMESWTGAYTGLLQSRIEEYFSVRLPGLIEAPGAEG